MHALQRASRVIAALAAVAGGTSEVAAQTPAPTIAYTGPSAEANLRAVRAVLFEFAQRRGLGLHDLADAPTASEIDRTGELDAAISDYSAFRYLDAIAKLDALESAAATTGASGLTRRQLADLFIYRAMSKSEAGATSDARDDLVRAATLFPSYQLDQARFRPSLVASFERARESVASSPEPEVKIDAPQGCVVDLDSETISPGTPRRLFTGTHYLRARCAGFHFYSGTVAVEPGTSEIAPALSLLPDVRVRALEAGRTAARLIWVDASRANPSRIVISLIEIETGATSRQWSLLIPDAAAASALEDVLTSILETEFSAPKPPAIIVIKEPSLAWYERKWVWVAVGAVAASAIIIPFAVRDSAPTGFGVSLESLP